MPPILPAPDPVSIFDILGVLSPFALPAILFILGNRKTAMKLFRSALAMAKQGNEEDDARSNSANAALMSRTDEISKRVDLVTDIQDRFDDGLIRIDDSFKRFQAEFRRELMKISQTLRNRLDSKLIEDSRMHKAQNERMDGHDEKFVQTDDKITRVETRLTAAEQTLIDLRAEVDGLKEV